jgi:peptidoglycan/LPS O-acetylase OafA/YrhL
LLKSLAQTTLKKNREIERLRAFAILMVLVQHLGKLRDSFHSFLRQGGPGVDLFFVISGYVVARSLIKTLPEEGGLTLLERVQRARPALAAFMVRRIYRILPMAVLWALLPLAGSIWFNQTGVWGKPLDLFKEVFAILTLQYNYAFAYGNGGRYSWYWSLAVEEHFYLLFPLLMVVLGTRQRRILGVIGLMALVALVLRPYLPFDGPNDSKFAWEGFTSHRKFDFLFAGALIYLLRAEGFLASWGQLPWGWAVLLGNGSLLGIYLSQGILPWGYFLSHEGQISLQGLAATAVLLASFERGTILPVPGLSRVLEWLGSRSYGVYLIHAVMIRVVDELHGRKGLMPDWFMKAYDGPWTYTALVVGSALVLAELCYWLLERPLIARGHRAAERLLVEARPLPVPVEEKAA